MSMPILYYEVGFIARHVFFSFLEVMGSLLTVPIVGLRLFLRDVASPFQLKRRSFVELGFVCA